ncbi:MAG: metallophosphoesterase [Planctomycetota bacterium]|nr:MAG: metallophosphoesterase [Planctomycetota bacterium]REJ87429.1 MAG: metallophosphoesterase [Planctomycetota bacterium]REK30779.1 MAG: metallophosphoesterase [Planctomycetota bacterium]REK42159.1 MAG: metallophosphoesterase [Planctomycetota bacterium]
MGRLVRPAGQDTMPNSTLWETLLVLLALVGHAAVWIGIFNNLHARKMPCWSVRTTSAICYLSLVLIPVAYATWYASGGGPLATLLARQGVHLGSAYVVVCWALAGWTLVRRLGRWNDRRDEAVLSNHTTRHDMLAELGPRYDGAAWATWLARLPGNQILDLHVHEMQLKLPRLPTALDGLSIAHLTDFHFTGAIGKSYFEEIVERTLACEPDLILITGDLIDKKPCLDWIDDTFGRLRAPGGVYYVLGNHDARVNLDELHRRMADGGLVHVGDRWCEASVRGETVIIAGNELPWFAPAADLDTAPAKDAEGAPPRILLAHTPDQFYWAQSHDVDLMLAGHTHGGQFRLPWVGPIVSPCREGTRYAASTYQRGSTVMHVGRGLSGTALLRVGCPPELGLITLRSAVAVAAAAEARRPAAALSGG